MQAYSKKHSCCAICNASIKKELEYGYCMDCAKEFLLPFSEKTEGSIDFSGLRQSKLVDKNDFYSGNDYEYWVTPDGELGSRDTSLHMKQSLTEAKSNHMNKLTVPLKTL